MNSRVVCLFLIGVFTFRAAAQDVESVSQAGGPTVEDLVMTILDPASGLTIVGQITPQNNTQIAGSTQLTDPRAMACFEAGEVGVAGTLLPPENQNGAVDADDDIIDRRQRFLARSTRATSLEAGTPSASPRPNSVSSVGDILSFSRRLM